MKCSKCGTVNKSNSIFCMNCGQKLKDVEYDNKSTGNKKYSIITSDEFIQSLDNLYKLYKINIVTDEEYTRRKIELFDELSTVNMKEKPEIFLGSILPLLDRGIVNDREIKIIKEIVFSKWNTSKKNASTHHKREDADYHANDSYQIAIINPAENVVICGKCREKYSIKKEFCPKCYAKNDDYEW